VALRSIFNVLDITSENIFLSRGDLSDLALKPKCLLYFVDEMSQAQACVYVFFRPPYLLREDFDGVGVRLQMHEGGVALRLIEFVNVRALQVLDELEFEAFRGRKRRLPCNRAAHRGCVASWGQDHLAGNGADFLLVLNSRTREEPMHEAKQMTTGQPVVQLHTRPVAFPPPRESAASQYRVGPIRFESGCVLVFHGGVFWCSSRMNGKPSSPVLREGWASAMAPGYSTICRLVSY
jgi:hypothetical protein